MLITRGFGINTGSGPGGFVLVDLLEVEIMSTCMDVEINNDPIDVDYVDTVEVEVVNNTIDVEIKCNE